MRGEIVLNQIVHAAIPIGYISEFNSFDFNGQILGGVVLALQGVYWLYKINNERKRGGKDAE